MSPDVGVPRGAGEPAGDDPALERVRTSWDAWGRDDPLWAVLTTLGLDRGTWDPEAFFATGAPEVATVLAVADDLGVVLRRGRALDFGCGVGRVTQALATEFGEAVGVDVAPSMVAAAEALNRLGDRCRYVLNPRPDLAVFPTGGFDCVFSKIVLQHMEPHLALGYVREFVRVLADGGLCVFQLPSHHVGRTPLPVGSWRAALTVAGVPRRVRPGATVRVEVSARNLGSEPWQPGNHAAVAAGAQWRHDDGRFVTAAAEGRLWVAAPVPPGGLLTGTLEVAAPAVPGRYELWFDMLQESIAWFHDRGGSPTRIPVVVGLPEVRALVRPLTRRLPAVLRRRLPGVATPVAPGKDPTPTMEMHGVSRDEVESTVVGAGGRVLLVQHDDAAPGWVSFTYWITKGGGPTQGGEPG
jgi:SAM-dependent methyltransferase